MEAIIESIKGAFSGLLKPILSFFQPVIDGILIFVDYLKSLISGLATFFETLFSLNDLVTGFDMVLPGFLYTVMFSCLTIFIIRLVVGR